MIRTFFKRLFCAHLQWQETLVRYPIPGLRYYQCIRCGKVKGRKHSIPPINYVGEKR